MTKPKATTPQFPGLAKEAQESLDRVMAEADKLARRAREQLLRTRNENYLLMKRLKKAR